MAWWSLRPADWSKFLRLSRGDKRLILQSLILLPLTGLTIRLVGLTRWLAAAAALSPVSQTSEPFDSSQSFQVRRMARMVDLASRHGLYRAGCLECSCLLWWLLRRRGIESQLRIGVRFEGSRLQAHAWLEQGGIALNDRQDIPAHFLPFDSPISPARKRAG